MELAIDRVSLLNSLSMVQGIVERRNTVPILGHVLLEPGEDRLKLSATDLEVGIRTEIIAETAQPAPLTLSARKLFEIVRETEAEKVTIKALEGDWFELRCGRARFKMMGLDPRSFPAMPSPNGNRDEQLRKLLDQAGESEAQLVIDGQLAWLRRGATELSRRLVEGEFPDYKGVIPIQSRYEIHIGRDTLLNAMRRAAIFSNERYHGVKL